MIFSKKKKKPISYEQWSGEVKGLLEAERLLDKKEYEVLYQASAFSLVDGAKRAVTRRLRELLKEVGE